MIWTEESAALLGRAYRHGTAVKTLGSWIAPRIRARAHVCDVGCGVGALSLELVRRGFAVTALDISSVALGQLQAHDGLEILCMDAREHTAVYDAMVFCFYADIEECLRMARRCHAQDVFYVSRDYDKHRFSVGEHPVAYRGYRDACAALEAQGIAYEARSCALDMGQPFVSLDEARRFFELYSRDDPALITDEFLMGRLMRTEDEQYPLYLPHLRAAGMIHLHVKDIPQPARISDTDQSNKK